LGFQALPASPFTLPALSWYPAQNIREDRMDKKYTTNKYTNNNSGQQDKKQNRLDKCIPGNI
jgi:hypothetical protein